jgi:hypothetical protein
MSFTNVPASFELILNALNNVSVVCQFAPPSITENPVYPLSVAEGFPGIFVVTC